MQSRVRVKPQKTLDGGHGSWVYYAWLIGGSAEPVRRGREDGHGSPVGKGRGELSELPGDSRAAARSGGDLVPAMRGRLRRHGEPEPQGSGADRLGAVQEAGNPRSRVIHPAAAVLVASETPTPRPGFVFFDARTEIDPEHNHRFR